LLASKSHKVFVYGCPEHRIVSCPAASAQKCTKLRVANLISTPQHPDPFFFPFHLSLSKLPKYIICSAMAQTEMTSIFGKF